VTQRKITKQRECYKELLNSRDTVRYSNKIKSQVVDGKSINSWDTTTWIAVWYPIARLQQIAVDPFNKMLIQVIEDYRKTKKIEDDEYLEYSPETNPMTVVYHKYDDENYIDIEMSFNFPNTERKHKNHKNRIVNRFLRNFSHVMTTALTVETLAIYKQEILNHQCAVMRSAMTQEGPTCFLNAAFNVVRLSTHLS
jgi:hypothetical protein